MIGKKGWIIYSKTTLNHKSNAFDWMMTSAKECGLDVSIQFAEDLAIQYDHSVSIILNQRKKEVKLPDFVLLRCYALHLGRALEAKGVKVINTTSAMERSRDKVLTHQYLTQKGISMPKTLFVEGRVLTYQELTSYFHEQPFVIKTTVGSKGEGVYLIETQQTYNKLQLDKDKSFLYQAYIEEAHGRDIRVYVIGDKVIGSVLRKSKGDFRSNYALGGTVEWYPINKEVELLAMKATQALGLEIAGVDILMSKKGYVVCEVNGNAGFRTLSQVSNISIPKAIFEYISNQGKSFEKNH